MRVGIYLGRHRGAGGGIGVYARALVRHLVELLGQPGYREDELVLYGDEAILGRELLDDLSLAEVLVTEAHESSLSGADRYFKLLNNGARCRVLVRQFPHKFGYKAGLLLDQVSLPFHACMDKVDVLHSVANFGAVFSSRRQVVTVHDLYQAFPPQLRGRDETPVPKAKQVTLQQRFFRHFFALQFRRIQHLLTDTAEVAQEIHRKYRFDLAKMNVVKLGLDPTFTQYLDYRRKSEYTELLQDWRGLYDLEPGFVLLIGSLDPRKNLNRQIEAWKFLPTELKKKKLVVLSSDPKTQRYIRRALGTAVMDARANETQSDRKAATPSASETVSDCVIYLPDIDRSEMPFLFDSAGVLLNATLAEGFGLPAHEALAVNTALVTSPLESLGGLSSELTFECNPTDIKSIGKALEMALELSVHNLSLDQASNPSKGIVLTGDENKWRTMKDCALETFNVYRQTLLRYEV